MTSRRTRVAVVQIDFLPAALAFRRSPLTDPLFEFGKPDHFGRPRGKRKELRQLRADLRAGYVEQLRRKVRAILEHLQRWQVRVALFPEYSLPWELLPDLAEATRDSGLVIIGGSHAVEGAALDFESPELAARGIEAKGIYAALGWHQAPARGRAVSPVLAEGRLVGLQTKLMKAHFEPDLTPGDRWDPIELPEGMPGPLGVFVCLDFLDRQSDAWRGLVAQDELDRCRFLAVPSLTPMHTTTEFGAKAWEEARRYKRPVLYANGARDGGTSIFVDEGAIGELRRFPERVGLLEPGDEGVIVADVDLGHVRVGRSRRYGEATPVVPVAAASLVYRARVVEGRYADWLDGMHGMLGDGSDGILSGSGGIDGIVNAIEEAEETLLDIAALRPNGMRARRLQELVDTLDGLTTVEQARQSLREVVLPADVLPLEAVHGALAARAGDEIRAWGVEGFEVFANAGARWKSPGEGVWDGAAASALAGLMAQPEHGASVRLALDPSRLGKQRAHGIDVTFGARDSKPLGLAGNAERERLIATAEGAQRAMIITCSQPAESSGSTGFAFGFEVAFISDHSGTWLGGCETDFGQRWARAVGAILQRTVEWRDTPDDYVGRVRTMRARFDDVRADLADRRAAKLADVNGAFVDLTVRIDDSEASGLATLDRWLDDPNDTGALVLGEYGRGKSTLLVEWARRCWSAADDLTGEAPLPLVVDLAAADAHCEPRALLLDAAGLDDTPANRAALRLLIYSRLLVPCFDGLDELATRVTAGELSNRLEAMVRAGEGRPVLVSSRDHYFESDDALTATLTRALGGAPLRVDVQPLSEEQQKLLVVQAKADDADDALERIARVYPLGDLAERPLLLGMVLQTLDDLTPGATVTRADVYQRYLERWLANTSADELFTPAEKEAFAERLAEDLWRTGRAECPSTELDHMVQQRLRLADDVNLASARFEIRGGAFFVRRGEAYRFAHKSFLEFFFARRLLATLPADPAAALATRPLTPEVLAFFAELLGPPTAWAEHPAITATRDWLATGRAGQEPAQNAAAAGNAARLLVHLARTAPAVAVPDGADLRAVSLAETDLSGARLVGVDLSDALLAKADLSDVDFTGARLDRARLNDARLDRANLERVSAVGACLARTAARDARLVDANLERTDLRGVAWRGGSVAGARGRGIRTAGAALPTALALPRTRQGGGRPPAMDWVRAVVCSPDGQHLASASDDNTVRVWDASTGEQTHTLHGHQRWVRAVVWSPDGQRLASASDDKTVRVWDASTGEQTHALHGHRREVVAVVWSPDSQRLASASDDNTVRVWDASTGEQTHSLHSHQHWVRAVVWSPDGQHLASASDDKTVRVWDASTGEQTHALHGHQGIVAAVVWSPDGQRLASASRDSTVRVWDASTGEQTQTLHGHCDWVRAVAWSPDGQRLASTSDDKTVRVWDASTGEQTHALQGHQDSVTAVMWSPDGQRLASASRDKTVRVWDASTGEQAHALHGHQDSVTAVVWSPDGQRLASASGDNTVRLWDASTGEQTHALHGYQNTVTAVVWSPDGQRLASASRDNAVRLWNTSTGEQTHSLDRHQRPVKVIVWSPDGQRLALASGDNTVRLWDASTGEQTHALYGHHSVKVIVWSPDGQRLASASGDNTVRLWDASTGEQTHDLHGHQDSVTAVVWSPDGQRLASAPQDKTVRVWDASTGEQTHALHGHQASVTAVVWSPDGQRLASASWDKTVRVWDASTGEQTHALHGSVTAVVWSPNGQRLASASGDNTVRVWDASTGEQTHALHGHQNTVKAVVWSPDGQRLASVSLDQTVRVWDASTGKQTDVFHGYHGTVQAVKWSTNGRCFVSVSEQSTVKIWQDGQCLATLWHEADGGWITVARGGLFAASDPKLARAWIPVPGSQSYLLGPMGPYADIYHAPKRVKAILAGADPDEQVAEAFAEAGLPPPVPWDGKEVILDLGDPNDPADAQHPFCPGVRWPADVLPPGRARCLARLRADLDRGAAVCLSAPRGIGATTLLAHMAHGLDDATHATLDAASVASLAAFQAHIATQGATLLLDDGHHLRAADPAVLEWLTSHHRAGHAMAIVASRDDWYTIRARGLDVEAAHTALQPIADADAIAWLMSASPADAPIPEPTARWIIDRVGTRPHYLHVLGRAVVEALWAGDRRPRVAPTAIDRLVDDLLVTGEHARFEQYWQTLTPDQRIAHLSHPPDDPVFARWIDRHRKALDTDDLRLRARVDRFFAAAGWSIELRDGDRWAIPGKPGDRRRVGALRIASVADAISDTIVNDTVVSLMASAPALIVGEAPTPAGARALTAALTAGHRLMTLIPDRITSATARGNAKATLADLIEAHLTRRDPFDMSKPVSASGDFFDRPAAEAALRDDIERGQSVGLFGLRKLGKTSLCQRVCAGFGGLAITVDAQGYGDRCGPLMADLPRHIRDAAAERWPDIELPPLPSDDAVHIIRRDVEAIADAIADAIDGDVPLLLFLDEIDRLVHRAHTRKGAHLDEFELLFGLLRSLGQRTDPLLVTLVAGFDPMITRLDKGLGGGVAGNPVYRYFTEHWLAPMSFAELRPMLRILGARAGLGFDDDAVERARRWSGGHPWLARQLGSRLLSDLGRGAAVDADAVDASARRMLADPDGRSAVTELLERVDDDQKALLRAVIDGAVAADDERLDDPAVRGLIVREADTPRVFAALVTALLGET